MIKLHYSYVQIPANFYTGVMRKILAVMMTKEVLKCLVFDENRNFVITYIWAEWSGWPILPLVTHFTPLYLTMILVCSSVKLLQCCTCLVPFCDGLNFVFEINVVILNGCSFWHMPWLEAIFPSILAISNIFKTNTEDTWVYIWLYFLEVSRTKRYGLQGGL